jgi:hypothetical protein
VNAGLTRWQIEDILAASEDVDVPAGLMLATAEEIRAALLRPVAESSHRVAGTVSPIRGARPARRARVRVAAVCAAALSLAVLLGAATTGALPPTVQDRVAKVGGLVGIHLPDADPGGPPDTGAVVGRGGGSTAGATAAGGTAENHARSDRPPGTSGTPDPGSGGSSPAGNSDADSGGNPNAGGGGNLNLGGGNQHDNSAGNPYSGGSPNNSSGNETNNAGGNGNNDPDGTQGGNRGNAPAG